MSNIISPVFRSELTEGNFKVIYQSESKGIFILYHKDDDLFIAEIRSRLSAKLFSVLTSCGIKNHFLCSNGIFEHKVLALDVLPFKFVVYSVVNEDLSKKIFLKPGLKLEKYLVEVYFKTGNESNDAVLLSKEHLVSLDSFTSDLVDHIFEQSRRIMDIVFSFFQAIGINVFSLSLSFGKEYKNDGENFEIILADEMSLKNINLSLSSNGSFNSKDSYLKISNKLDFNI